jgi:hypothetical protein
LNASYLAHVLRLTLLAPLIVEAILDGRQPRTMQLQPLLRKGFPVKWERQRDISQATERNAVLRIHQPPS